MVRRLDRVPAPARQLLPLAVALAYLVAAVVGLGATQDTDGLAALWPPNAILLAVLLLGPRHPWRYIAWCACAALAANSWFGTSGVATLIFTAANAGGAVAATVLGRRLGVAPTAFDRPSDIARFCGIALAAAGTGATIASLAARVGHGSAIDLWVSWFSSDLLGMLVITPLGLMIAWARHHPRDDQATRRPIETAALLLLVALVAGGVFYQSRYPLLFLPIAPLLAVTYRVGPTGTAAGIILIAATGIAATLAGHGPVALAAGSIAAHIHFLQLYLATLFGISLPMASALAHRRRLAQSVAESERLLRLAGTVARLGHWRYGVVDDRLDWSDEVFRIHGLEPGSVPDIDEAIAVFHPEDRDIVSHLVGNALEKGEDYKFDARIVLPDGAVRHVIVYGRVERDADGTITGLFGVIQDVTERKLAEIELRASEERFRAITEQSGDLITLHTTQGQALFVSAAAIDILGHDPSRRFGGSAFDWVVPEDHPEIARMRDRLQTPERPTVHGRVRMPCADGSLAWMEVAARLVTIAGEDRAVAIWRDVSAQVEAQAALEAARAEAEAALGAKAQFLANMSHEIRTPMNGVLGFTELLLGSDLSPEQARHAQLIADAGKAMMKLLNDILDVSKIDAGQLDIVPEPMDLLHTLKGCAALLTPAAEQKTLSLDLDLAPDLPRAIMGDALRIRQVVLNLIGNAIKFTAVGGVILSARRADDATLVVTVTDTGIGIPAERQNAIFEQFVQADQSIARRYGGSGLGLAISNRLAALMGGRLSLDSVPGRGTAVTLTLPLDEVDERTLPAKQAAAPAPAPAARTAHVLLADDHDINQVLVTMMLARAGHRVTIANDGAEAVERVKAAIACGETYDLVLMDMQMPGMDGLTATRVIRTLPGAEALPVVALTANAFAADLDTCRAAGMNDHLAKPVSSEALLGAVERWAGPAPAPKRRGFVPSPELMARYASQKAATLQALACAVRSGAYEDSTVADLAERLHKLAGTAAMFGDAALGDQARTLEANLKTWNVNERIRRLRAAADALRRVA